jgi:hypothetical protein
VELLVTVLFVATTPPLKLIVAPLTTAPLGFLTVPLITPEVAIAKLSVVLVPPLTVALLLWLSQPLLEVVTVYVPGCRPVSVY